MDPGLKAAVERMLDCSASFIEGVVVVEKFGEQTVWSGTGNRYQEPTLQAPVKE